MLQNEKVLTDDGYADQSRLRLEHVYTSKKNILCISAAALKQ